MGALKTLTDKLPLKSTKVHMKADGGWGGWGGGMFTLCCHGACGGLASRTVGASLLSRRAVWEMPAAAGRGARSGERERETSRAGLGTGFVVTAVDHGLVIATCCGSW
jgi:hypothetical protein